MAKIDITKTELVWPGKYNEDGPRKEVPRVNLSFQLIETVNGSRATREAQQIKTMPLYGVYQGKERNLWIIELITSKLSPQMSLFFQPSSNVSPSLP